MRKYLGHHGKRLARSADVVAGQDVKVASGTFVVERVVSEGEDLASKKKLVGGGGSEL